MNGYDISAIQLFGLLVRLLCIEVGICSLDCNLSRCPTVLYILTVLCHYAALDLAKGKVEPVTQTSAKYSRKYSYEMLLKLAR